MPKKSHTPQKKAGPKEDLEDLRHQSGLASVDSEDWVCVGMFAGAHGVRGDVRLKSFTEDPDDILSFDRLYRGAAGAGVSIEATKRIKGGFAVSVTGIDDCNAAEAQQGIRLYVPRAMLSDLAEDEFYLADLIGLEAVDKDAEPLGQIRAVENYGADDLLEIGLYSPQKGIGKSAMIPFRESWVPVVDIKAGRVVVAFQEWLSTQVEVPTDDSKAESEKNRNKTRV